MNAKTKERFIKDMAEKMKIMDDGFTMTEEEYYMNLATFHIDFIIKVAEAVGRGG